MKALLTAPQIRLADQHTVAHEPVASIDLMERASLAFVEVFQSSYPQKEVAIAVYCGTGNNGGDGLAIARLLSREGYRQITIKIVRYSSRSMEDFAINYKRVQESGIAVVEIKETDPFPTEEAEVIIDAILGSGLNKPLEGRWKELVNWLNRLNKTVVAVDIPTGLRGEGLVCDEDVAIRSALTICFQRPKISFLLPESSRFMDSMVVVEIGLDENFIQSQDTPYYLLTREDVTSHLIKRKQFSHKGTFGHSLIIAGAPETMGAALLCAEASLRTGSGLTTACIPTEGLIALNCRVPEVMAMVRTAEGLPEGIDWKKYSSIAIGPGLGTSYASKVILEQVLQNVKCPVVFDADALNLLGKHTFLLSSIPGGSILTPHMKEFDRLFGAHTHWWNRLQTGRLKAAELNSYIVLKNRYTIIFTPQGHCLFNPTGTPAMASGGMGDVLTGIIVSLLAQGYPSEVAAWLGVYLHGLAGERVGGYVVVASDIIKELAATMENPI